MPNVKRKRNPALVDLDQYPEDTLSPVLILRCGNWYEEGQIHPDSRWLCNGKFSELFDCNGATEIRLVAHEGPDPGYTYEVELSTFMDTVTIDGTREDALFYRLGWWLHKQDRHERRHIGALLLDSSNVKNS